MKTMLKSLLAIGLAAGITTASLHEAKADRRGFGVGAGVAAGIIGLGVLGAYSSRGYAYSRACYEREFCNNVGRRCWENRYGETVCRGGEVVCRVRTVCP